MLSWSAIFSGVNPYVRMLFSHWGWFFRPVVPAN
jgi:hypothetical protein